MSNLRERKKESAKKRIFETALTLFEELGYEKTTIEKIAAGADLGVGTLYNYYPSKLDLLFSIIESGAGKYIKELDEIIEDCTDLYEAVFQFHSVYLKSFSTYGKRVWGELFAILFFQQSEVLKRIDIIDEQFSDKLRELLTLFRNRGVLSEKADIQAGVSSLYSLLGYNVIRYVSDREMTEKELMELLQKQSGLIVRALLG